MNAVDAIKYTLDTADMITRMYLEDLSDEEMMYRPHAACNHIKWQMGHLIASDHQMINGCLPDVLPALPDGFESRYDRECCRSDEPEDFDNKVELLSLFDQQRQALRETLAGLSAEDLNAEAPETMRAYAPTLGAALSMVGLHWTMHTGQWAVIRRQLGRAPVI